MARKKSKGSYVADPQRRAYLASVRRVREQVNREHREELSKAGFFRRVLLLFRIEREIKRRLQGIEPPPVRPRKRPPLK